MSKKQLEEQRRYDILQSEFAKAPKKPTNNTNWFLDYCKKYDAKMESTKKGKE